MAAARWHEVLVDPLLLRVAPGQVLHVRLRQLLRAVPRHFGARPEPLPIDPDFGQMGSRLARAVADPQLSIRISEGALCLNFRNLAEISFL